jgi:hypothetical protein
MAIAIGFLIMSNIYIVVERRQLGAHYEITRDHPLSTGSQSVSKTIQSNLS